jgi:hypothetical protein
MRVSPLDCLDRIGSNENDLEVVAPFVLALKRSVGDGRLIAINKLPLADKALSAEVVDKEEVSKGHKDRLPPGVQGSDQCGP